MRHNCSTILEDFSEDVNEVVDIQRNDRREAIFFIFEQGFTEGPYKGSHTSISLSRDEEKRINRMGNVVGSVHTHPSGLDPSTIDIVTGISSGQDTLCVATPVVGEEDGEDFVLTCLDFSQMGKVRRQQALQAMRRASVGITNIGRVLRRDFNFKRFSFDQCRVKG